MIVKDFSTKKINFIFKFRKNEDGHQKNLKNQKNLFKFVRLFLGYLTKKNDAILKFIKKIANKIEKKCIQRFFWYMPIIAE